MDILGLHLDMKQTLDRAKKVVTDIEAKGRKAVFINTNAADEARRAKALDKFQNALGGEKIKAVMHSLAFGSLKPLVTQKAEDCLTKAQIDMTMDVMANSLVYWIQDLLWRDLLADDARVFAMTSEGSHRVLPITAGERGQSGA